MTPLGRARTRRQPQFLWLAVASEGIDASFFTRVRSGLPFLASSANTLSVAIRPGMMPFTRIPRGQGNPQDP